MPNHFDINFHIISVAICLECKNYYKTQSTTSCILSSSALFILTYLFYLWNLKLDKSSKQASNKDLRANFMYVFIQKRITCFQIWSFNLKLGSYVVGQRPKLTTNNRLKRRERKESELIHFTVSFICCMPVGIRALHLRLYQLSI